MAKDEWTAYDPETDRLKTLVAETHLEAIRKAYEKGVKPQRTEDVRPRTCDRELLTQEEFEDLL
jgi:hypothetical protein